MLGIAHAISAELFAQDCVIRVTFADTEPQKLLCPSVRLRNLRSVRLVIDSHVLPARQDELTGLPRERQCKLEDIVQGRFGHRFYFASARENRGNGKISSAAPTHLPPRMPVALAPGGAPGAGADFAGRQHLGTVPALGGARPRLQRKPCEAMESAMLEPAIKGRQPSQNRTWARDAPSFRDGRRSYAEALSSDGIRFLSAEEILCGIQERETE